jgi:hypothetical protein
MGIDPLFGTPEPQLHRDELQSNFIAKNTTEPANIACMNSSLRGRRLRCRLERVKGIEPSYEAWEAAVLPLNYTRRPRRL